MSKNTEPSTCSVCHKRREHECAHVECPRRKRLTAAPPGDPTTFPSCGRRHGRQDHNFYSEKHET
jgi:hypothetical protein